MSSSSFESTYPALSRWVLAGGGLALGGRVGALVSLSDGGRHLWADGGAHTSLAEALAAAETFARDPALRPGQALCQREVSLRSCEPRLSRRLEPGSSAEACVPQVFDQLFAHGARLSLRELDGRVHAYVHDPHGWLGWSVTHSAGIDDMLEEAGELALRSLACVREPVAVSLARFVATAELGPISLGMSPAQIEGLIGPPEDLLFSWEERADHHLADIWKYHGLELYFMDADEEAGGGRELVQISRSSLPSHFERVPSRAFVIDFDLLSDGALPNYQQLEQLAVRLGLTWEYFFMHEQAHMVLSSGVYFIFAGDEGGLEWRADNRAQWSLECEVDYVGTNPGHVARLRQARATT